MTVKGHHLRRVAANWSRSKPPIVAVVIGQIASQPAGQNAAPFFTLLDLDSGVENGSDK